MFTYGFSNPIDIIDCISISFKIATNCSLCVRVHIDQQVGFLHSNYHCKDTARLFRPHANNNNNNITTTKTKNIDIPEKKAQLVSVRDSQAFSLLSSPKYVCDQRVRSLFLHGMPKKIASGCTSCVTFREDFHL